MSKIKRLLAWAASAWMYIWTAGWWPWESGARYVVMAVDPSYASTPPFQVYSGGVAYGMDYDSGVFPNRESALRFCEYRQYECNQYTNYIYYIQREGAV